eukprot:1213496-Amphidinium_carterae.1
MALRQGLPEWPSSGLYNARDDGDAESGAHDMALAPQRNHVNVRVTVSTRQIRNLILRGVATRPPL